MCPLPHSSGSVWSGEASEWEWFVGKGKGTTPSRLWLCWGGFGLELGVLCACGRGSDAWKMAISRALRRAIWVQPLGGRWRCGDR